MSRSIGLAVLAGFFAACSSSAGSSSTTSSSSGSVASGSSGVLVTSSSAPSSSTPGTELTTESLETMTTMLSSDEMNGRDEGTEGSASARQHIIDELMRCGVEAAGLDGFTQAIEGGNGTNILGVVRGTDETLRDRYVVLSAHYDHLGACGGDICNGANDNAAGVSIMLAVACQVARQPLARSVLVAAWDAEEPPTFLSARMGSEYFVNHPTVALTSIDVAIAMDLVGGELWPGYMGHFVLGSELSPQVHDAVAAAVVPDGLLVQRTGLHLVETTPAGQQPWSDYDAFRDEGVPVLFFSNGQNKRYHTPDDEPDTLNYPKMALQAGYLLDIVTRLGQASATPVFDANGRDDASEVNAMVEVLEAALATNGAVDALSLSQNSRTLLQEDLDAIRPIRDAVNGGASMTAGQRTTLRRGTQHLMCLCGSTYSEAVCGSF